MARGTQAEPGTNRLLERLPASDRTQLLAKCERVELAFSEVLAEAGGTIRDLYFPTGSFISLQKAMEGGGLLEVGLAGSEGLYGVPIVLGVDVSPVHAMVRGGGSAWRISAASFRRERARIPSLREGTDRYIHVLMAQQAQAAGCGHFHVIERRVARWLLATADRAHSNRFHITHEFLARLLGVRRVGITEAAGALQARDLISYARGEVSILDRKGLERAACSCYRSDLRVYEAIMGSPVVFGSAPTARGGAAYRALPRRSSP